jgi:disulfide bond formation protein DsbB
VANRPAPRFVIGPISTAARRHDSTQRLMTDDLTGTIPLPAPAADRAAMRRAALAVAAIGAATIAGAWFFELALDIRPCPLCLEQRYAYYLAIPLALLLAQAAPRAPRGVLVAGFGIVAAAMLINAGLGAYHSGVEWGWWPGPTACSGGIGDLGDAASLLDRLQSAKVIRCDAVQWRFLGLSLAGYNVLISLAMAAIAALGIRPAAKRAR